METFEEAVPLYLKACEVEGKTDAQCSPTPRPSVTSSAQSTNSNCPTR